MKPAAVLINASRGEVLDAAALAAAVREKRIAGAAVDVFDPEPPPADYPLLGLDNVRRGGAPNPAQLLRRWRGWLEFVAIVIIRATIWLMQR